VTSLLAPRRTRMKLTAVLFALLLATAGCAHAAHSQNSRAIDDAKITTEIKTVFLNDPLDEVWRIDVETVRGVVTLSGRVKSKDEESRAIALARKIRGVVEVKSTLRIE
jgi:hyperosmotically inducible periplasmic protein